MESMNTLVSTIINQNGRYSTSIKDFFYLNTDRTVNTYIIGVHSHYKINQPLLVCRKYYIFGSQIYYGMNQFAVNGQL